MFVRHLNGFYKTSDMLKLLQAESNRNNGLGIVSEDYVDMARFT